MVRDKYIFKKKTVTKFGKHSLLLLEFPLFKTKVSSLIDRKVINFNWHCGETELYYHAGFFLFLFLSSFSRSFHARSRTIYNVTGSVNDRSPCLKAFVLSLCVSTNSHSST